MSALDTRKALDAIGMDLGVHPLIIGLMIELPEPQSEWSIYDRDIWTDAAKAIFELLYIDKPDDDATSDFSDKRPQPEPGTVQIHVRPESLPLYEEALRQLVANAPLEQVVDRPEAVEAIAATIRIERNRVAEKAGFKDAPAHATVDDGLLLIGDEAWTLKEWAGDQGKQYRRRLAKP